MAKRADANFVGDDIELVLGAVGYFSFIESSG
jgi:hypothetical protein